MAPKTASRWSLRRSRGPTLLTTAIVPPPNITGVDSRSTIWPIRSVAEPLSPRTSQRSSGMPLPAACAAAMPSTARAVARSSSPHNSATEGGAAGLIARPRP